MATLFFRNEDDREHAEVSDLHPLPTMVKNDPTVRIRGTTKQVSVATTATLIAAGNVYRRSIKITNVTGTQLIYLGFDAAVATTTGDYLHSAAGSNTTLYSTDPIWGIAVTGAQTVSVMEEDFIDA